jgi:hypothetical protein
MNLFSDLLGKGFDFASSNGLFSGGSSDGGSFFGGAGKAPTYSVGNSTANKFNGTTFKSPLTQARSSPSGRWASGGLWSR